MISIKNLLILAIAELFWVDLVPVLAQVEDVLLLQDPGEKLNACSGWKTCGECTAASAECQWCTAPAKEFKSDRCDTFNNLILKGCNQTSIVTTNHSWVEDIQNESPRDSDSTKNLSVIQLSPQHIKLHLRPHVPVTFPVTFRVAQNYPVDLYFLIDMSATMKHHRDALADMADVMASSIGKITKDFRLGFGSFVDKIVLPFTDYSFQQNITFDPYYGFKNRLGLTKNVTAFRQLVSNAPLSANLDGPEGGFDAIMQVLSCQNEIGWRSNSRKLLLYFTDDIFHYAGSGKLGGLMVPNDEQCHLNSEGLYSESSYQDYPSVSQLIRKIADTKVNVVFAITDNKRVAYDRLSSYISGSAVGILSSEKSTPSVTTGGTPEILKIVQDNYNRIRTSIQLQADSDEHITVSYLTNCVNQPTSSVPQCSDINMGTSVTFNVTVVAHSCPKDGEVRRRKSFQISPVGITEKLTIDVEYVCQCDCEKSENLEPSSKHCNGTGTESCGICACDKGYLGEYCQCNVGNMDLLTYENLCIKKGSFAKCEGRGVCECGKCTKCSLIPHLGPGKFYSGPYCECNDYNCEPKDPKTPICGGPTRGVCQCGACKCKNGYTGKYCDCSTSIDRCLDSKGGKECNGRGKCVCGNCTCDDGYHGPTCGNCTRCKEMCNERKECVECHLHSLQESCHRINCSRYHIETVHNINAYGSEWSECQFVNDSDSCKIDFKFNSNDIKVTKTCKLDEKLIIIIVVTAVFLTGLLSLVIWKTVITIHDRREYERFKQERANPKWAKGENGIYVHPVTTFDNPSYKATTY